MRCYWSLLWLLSQSSASDPFAVRCQTLLLTGPQEQLSPSLWLQRSHYVLFQYNRFLKFSGLSITNISKNSTKNVRVNLDLNLSQTVLCLNNKWRGLRVRRCCWCAEIAACHNEQWCFIGFLLLCLPLSLISCFVLDLSLWQTERLNVFWLHYTSF